MKYKIQITKQTREDGSIYFLPFIIISKLKLFGIYWDVKKHGISKVTFKDIYYIRDSFFKWTYPFSDYKEAVRISEIAIKDYDSEIKHSKVVKEEII